MRRINQQLVCSELPAWDPERLSDDHVLYLRHMLGMLETGDMFHGRFVEVHVGRILRADIADRGINGWDLRIAGPPPITIEVKATARGRRYRIGPKDADVWVFVTFDDKLDGPDHFSYAVARADQLAGLPGRVRQEVIFTKFGSVPRRRLRHAVITAARSAP